MNDITGLITYLALLSVAAERCVELVKNIFKLDEKLKNAHTHRAYLYHILAVLFSCGLIVSSICPVPVTIKQPVLMLAILASAGSSVWNSVVVTLLNIKNNQKL